MSNNNQVKFLAICNPDLYKSAPLDVPTFYQQLSQDSRFDFYHLPTNNVFHFSANHNLIQVANVPHGVSYDELLKLNNLAIKYHQLDSFDLVFCRTLKPFPPYYLQHLSNWEKVTKFVNTPSNKIEQIEADFLVKVAKDYIPDTIVTDDYEEAFAFWDKHQTIVTKQVNSCGGRGIFKVSYDNGVFTADHFKLGKKQFANFQDVINYAQGNTNQPLQLVRYLNQVNRGDKRVVVVDGEIYGAYLRVSSSGHWVNNISADGQSSLAEVTSGEKEVIANTFTHYQKRGLNTLGYDFLMDDDGTWRLSEINAGNIGGFAHLERLTGKPVMQKFIDWLFQFSQKRSEENPITLGREESELHDQIVA